MFVGCSDKATDSNETAEGVKDLSRGKNIEEMVADYNLTIDKCTEVITSYFKNYHRVVGYIGLNQEKNRYINCADMTDHMQIILNDTIKTIRHTYWQKVLNLDAVGKRLTVKKRDEFYTQLETQAIMDFTASNIRQFVLNIIGGYENTLIDAVVALFDQFTDYSYHDGPNEKNIHYFNGWKTNSAFKINKKIIIPIYNRYGNPFINEWSKKWKLDCMVERILTDIDKVMNYFDGLANFHSIFAALEGAFEAGKSKKILSTYFTLTAYKKGTLHLTFNDDDILRRFNVVACKRKKWLPENYGEKGFNELETSEQTTIESFEGKESYEKNRLTSLFAVNKIAITDGL